MPSSASLPGSRRPAASALLFLLYLTACHTWQTGTPTPAQFVEREHPAQVQVTRTDGSTVILDAPSVRGDSLVGQSVGTPDSVGMSGVPLGDVTSVAVKKAATGRTVLLTAGIVVAVVAAGMIAVWEIYCEQDEC